LHAISVCKNTDAPTEPAVSVLDSPLRAETVTPIGPAKMQGGESPVSQDLDETDKHAEENKSNYQVI
jgi:hypothetical protein